ncbi:MAG: hypothetical protein ABI399_08235 [Bauldia sp.]
MFQRLRRLVLVSTGAASFLAAAIVGVLAYPDPLYGYRVTEGRLSLLSDQPFDAAKGRAVLADIERRLAFAPPAIVDPDSTYRIFVSNSEWRRRLTFLWSYGAGGVNYYPIAGSVFLRQADIDRDRLIRWDGSDVPLPRSLAYYGGQEIGHSLIGKRIGARANWRLPAWIREGVADYVGFGGEVDIEALTRQLRAGDRELDPKASGLYARYRLLVTYLLKREGWTIDRLLASNLSQAEAERRLLAGVPAD